MQCNAIRLLSNNAHCFLSKGNKIRGLTDEIRLTTPKVETLTHPLVVRGIPPIS